MKIYTKTGDDGNTSLFGGERVQKNNLRINAYGTIDELNAVIGIAVAKNVDEEVKNVLVNIQNTLFVLGSELATPQNVKSSAIKNISENEINFLENSIDTFDIKLPELKNFILPGGSEESALLHFARTICRRAERIVVDLELTEKINHYVLIYLNRLSDLLFVLARYENYIKATPEIEWKTRG